MSTSKVPCPVEINFAKNVPQRAPTKLLLPTLSAQAYLKVQVTVSYPNSVVYKPPSGYGYSSRTDCYIISSKRSKADAEIQGIAVTRCYSVSFARITIIIVIDESAI